MLHDCRRVNELRPAGPARGGAAAGADRRADAARRPRGELLVSAPPRRLRVDRRARARGRRVVDLACGEGYGSDVLARARRRSRRRRRQPGGPRARAAALPAPEPALRARPGRGLRRARATRSSSCRRSSTSTSPGRCSSGFAARRAGQPTSRPRTGSRWPRPARRSRTTPGTCASTRPASTASCSSPHFSAVEILGLFHAASCALHELALRLGWDRVHQALRLTKPFYDRFVPAIAASDFTLVPATRDLDRALDFVAVCRSDVTTSPRAAVGDLAIVLHSHMPYVEGFGTYPFGEEWLFDAVDRSYLPVLEVAERLTMTVTPVLADQLEADGVARAAARVPPRATGSARPSATPPTLERELRDAGAAEAEPLSRGRSSGSSARRRPARALSRAPAPSGGVELIASAATHAVLPMLATRAGRRLQIDAGLRSHRRRFGEPARASGCPSAPTSRAWKRLLAERGIGYFCLDQSAHETGDGGAGARSPPPAGRSRSRSTGRRSSWLWSQRRLSVGPGYRRVPPQVAARRPAVGDRRRPLRPRGRRGASARAGRRVPRRVSRDGWRGFAAERGAPRPLRVRDRHRAARPLVVGGAGVARGRCSTALPRHGRRAGRRCAGARASTRPSRGRWRRRAGARARTCATWDSPAVADMAWAARRLELRLLRGLGPDGPGPAAAERAARELLALQASDWAFLDHRGQAGDYPFRRAVGHAEALLEAIDSAAVRPNRACAIWPRT